MKGFLTLAVAIICVTIGFIAAHVWYDLNSKEEVVVELCDQDTTTLTKENLKREIARYPFHNPTLVMKSAILECGHGLDSYNATERKNLFGMKCSVRKLPCSKGYTVYLDWQESVKDRYVHEALWFRGGSYRDYINRNWGVMDGKYCDQLDKIKL